jgi:dihydroxyacetone kinase-like predicted kinase
MQESEINARVVPSKTIPQGMVSAMNFNPEDTPEQVYEDMKAALKTVRSGSVTYAIKDTDIDGVHITKDYYMAMKDKNIVSCVKDKLVALDDLCESLVRERSAMMTVLVGADVSEEEEKEATDRLNAKYGDNLEILVRRGDQPVYSFLIGVEE